MSTPPTIVRLSEGTILRDDERIKLIAKAIQRRYRDKFVKLRPDAPESLAVDIASWLVHFTQKCGEMHNLKEFSHQLQLGLPNERECRAVEELASKIVEFRYVENLPTRKHAVEKAANVIWRELHEALGLKPKMPPPGPSAAGPRG
jgi:hypothetical protein